MADDDFALVSAALRRDVPGMQAALRAGADPLQAAPGGLTALHAAAMWGLAEAVPLLVSAGAGVDARMASTVEVAAFMQSRGFTLPGKYTLRFVDDDATPLHLAASEGSAATVRALLAAGADPNSVSGERWTPLSTICQRLDSGRLPAALALVEGGADCLLPFPGSNACILELMDRASMRCVLQRVYEQQRWPGARCSARLGQRSTAVPALDLQQLERVATIASRKGSPKPACYFMLRAREQVQHQEQQQQAPPQPPQQQNAAALHRALLHGAARNDDERVLPALMEAGIGEGLTPNDLTLALHAAVRRLRRRIAAVLLTHGAGVLLATLCSAVCTTLEAAGRSFRGGRHRRLLQRGLDVLRLLLAHGRPQVPLGSPTHPVSIACCPFYAMIARLHRGGRMAGHWPSGGEFDQTWGWNRRLNSAPPELLRMAETLAAAGYRPAVFQHCTVPGDDEVLQDCCPFDDKADHGGHITQMVEITAWQVGWAPELHSRFPPAFRAAARALLLAQRRPATAAAGGSSRRRQRSSEGQGQSRNPLALLSADVVLRIIGQAAHPLSSWL